MSPPPNPDSARKVAIPAPQEEIHASGAALPAIILRFVQSPDGSRIFPYVSEGIREIVGIEPAEMLADAELPFRRVVAEDLPGLDESIRRSFESLGLWEHEFRMNTPTGRVVWLRGKARPQRLPGGEVLWDAVLLDVTEIKATEERLRLFEAAMRDNHDSVVITDAELDAPGPRIVYVNEAFTRMTGYAPQEVLGKTPRILQGPKTDRAILCSLRESLQDGKSFTGETVNYRKDGSEFLLRWRISPVRDDRGKVTHFVAIQRDVTERRRMENQLSLFQRLEGIARLAGGIAHDFNNLLTIITGYARLLGRRVSKDETTGEYLREIKQATDRAQDLTRQLLAYSRRQVMNFRAFDLRDGVQGMEGMLRRLAGEGVDLSFSYGTGPIPIYADLAQIQQVLVNLVSNACDAVAGGGGRVSVEVGNVDLDEQYAAHHVSVKPGPYARLAVTDSGHGMEPEILNRVFEPFFTTKTSQKAAGMGLPTSYGIVKQSGGNIWAYSEPGVGSTFKVYLPLVQSAEGAVAPSAAAPSVPPPGRKGVLLVVEDEASLRRLACTILRDAGYEILEASNGEEALAVAQEYAGTIDLLLTDVIMPKMGGAELAKHMAEIRPATRVLYMSGYAEGSIAENGRLAEGAVLLEKPFSPEAVEAKIRQVLSGAPSR